MVLVVNDDDVVLVVVDSFILFIDNVFGNEIVDVWCLSGDVVNVKGLLFI